MYHPLDDCYLNIARAKQHFAALEKELLEWHDANGKDLGVTMVFNYETGDDPLTGARVTIVREDLVVFDPVPPLPPTWGAIVGDIVHNLRSALDYVVYELAVKGSGHPDRDNTAFPISKTLAAYTDRRGKAKQSYRDICLVGVAEQWKSEIDKLQPYETSGRAELAALAFLSNRNKHRTGVRVRWRIVTARFAIVVESGNLVKNFQARIKGFDEGEIKVEAVNPGTNREFVSVLEKHPHEVMGFTVSFGATPPLTLFQMKELIVGIEEIVNIFKPAFEP